MRDDDLWAALSQTGPVERHLLDTHGISSDQPLCLDGVRLRTLHCGTPPAPGEPRLILLHDVDEAASAWAPLLANLSEQGGPAALALDLPGFGHAGERSDVDLSRPADVLRSAVRTLTTFLDETPAPTFLIGHGLGARLAVEVAASSASPITAVALVAPLGILPLPITTSLQAAIHQRLARLSANAPQRLHAELSHPYGGRPFARALSRIATRPPWLPRSPRVPTLLVFGTKDPYLPAAVRRQVCAWSAAASVRKIPSGHHLNRSHIDELTRELRDFMARHDFPQVESTASVLATRS